MVACAAFLEIDGAVGNVAVFHQDAVAAHQERRIVAVAVGCDGTGISFNSYISKVAVPSRFICFV